MKWRDLRNRVQWKALDFEHKMIGLISFIFSMKLESGFGFDQCNGGLSFDFKVM